jgi:hypothetical protein
MDENATNSWSEATASRWAVDPERIDPDDYPASRVFIKVMTWAPCDACQTQVHAPASQFLLRGLTCPGCGQLLLAPPEDATDRLRTLLRQEDELSEQV